MARSRRSQGSLGSSWAEDDYTPDSSDAHSEIVDISDSGSAAENDYEDEDDMPTPMPPRNTRASSQNPSQPKSQRKNSAGSYFPSPGNQSSRDALSSSRNTRLSVEPDLVMPSMQSPIEEDSTGSPMRGSQARPRRAQPWASQTRSRRLPPVREQPRQTTKAREAPGRSKFSRKQEQETSPWHFIELFYQHLLLPTLQYFLQTLMYAVHHFLTPVLGLALAALLILTTLRFTSNFLQSSIQSALAPICVIPGSSYLVPFCDTTSSSDPSEPPDFEQLVDIQNSFESVVQSSRDHNDLAKHLRAGGAAVGDIKSIVKYSQLPSRAQLEVELVSFISTAKDAADMLQTYNARIGSTLSRVIITNEWTLRDLQGLVDTNPASISGSALSQALSYINPLSPFLAARDTLDHQIYTRYVTHLSTLQPQISALITTAESLSHLLTGLENQLAIIADLAIHDNIAVASSHADLLASLWTQLGGNRSSKKAHEASLATLKKVLEYKGRALTHVLDTLHQLKAIASGLENLREEVQAPEILGYRPVGAGGVPLEYHIEVISRSLEGFRDLRGERLGIEKDEVRRELDRLRAGEGYEDGVVNRGLPAGRRSEDDIPLVYAKTARSGRES